MAPADQAAVVCLATELGEWFNADGLREIATDLRYQPGFVAEMNGQIIGFVVISVYEAKGRISWLGVQRDRQRMGIGRRRHTRLPGASPSPLSFRKKALAAVTFIGSARAAGPA